MADIQRNDKDIMLRDMELFIKHLQVLLSEKLNQLKQLDVHLDNLRTVEMKRIELKKATLEKEIQEIKYEIKQKSVIDVTPKKGE
ncbi:MAG: hypothetical protein GWN64_17215 [Candidatus Thorarchaeota archaeon]|nr:hypothetical protein [Candidatus Thorarchaeota archaeon]